MARPRRNDYPPYMLADKRRGGFIVRNPETGKQKSFSDEQAARAAALELAGWIERERQRQQLYSGRPTIAGLVDCWQRDKLPFMPWDEGTRRNVLWRMRRLRNEIGDRVLERTNCVFLDGWLSQFCRTADQWNKWRYVLVLLWRYAVARGLAKQNEAEKLEPRSTSKKLEINRKVRQPLDVDGFKAVHGHAKPWLQLAMEMSLLTLQARQEICNMKHADFRDGYLFVIRDKVSGDSDMAFIKIAVTEELEALRRRSLTLDRAASPYVVHRTPVRRRRQWIEGKPHWTYVNPGYCSQAFAEARDRVERYVSLPTRQRPTFHEIRGLGARLMRDRGVPEKAIQALMTHAHKRTTQIYLDRGPAALTDADYHPVATTLRLSEILGQ